MCMLHVPFYAPCGIFDPVALDSLRQHYAIDPHPNCVLRDLRSRDRCKSETYNTHQWQAGNAVEVVLCCYAVTKNRFVTNFIPDRL